MSQNLKKITYLFHDGAFFQIYFIKSSQEFRISLHWLDPYVYQLFERKGIAYFDGLQKTYSYELVIELIFVVAVILFLALSSGIFYIKEK
jgi:hypothetical protein